MSRTGLQSQQWGRKVGAARAVKALCEIGGKGSLAQHAPGVARQLLQVRLLAAGCFSLWHPPTVSAYLATLLPYHDAYFHSYLICDQPPQEIPGRLWDGKEVVLEALGSLVAAEPQSVQPAEDVINALVGTLP